MALNKKVNIPASTANPLPNINNLTGEAQYVAQLLNKTNRSNSGQNTFTSSTSGITYKTSDYPSDPAINNAGETGLYNLLVKLYGGDKGWMMMADDYNQMVNNINNNSSNIDINTANITKNTSDISKNTTDIATNKSNIAINTTNISKNTTDIATNKSNIDGIQDGTVKVPWSGIKDTPATYPPNMDDIYTKAQTDSQITSLAKLKGEFYLLTGTIPVDGSTGKGNVVLSYPSGFSNTNSVIIDASTDAYGAPFWESYSAFSGIATMNVSLRNVGVYVGIEARQSSGIPTKNLPCRVMLMKI